MIVARFPELSPDFIELPDGKPKRIPERVDNDIQMIFHDANHDQIWFVEHEAKEAAGGKPFEIIHRRANGGKVERFALSLGERAALRIGTATMNRLGRWSKTDASCR